MEKKVTHLIAGLGKGGAETMLYQTLKYRISKDITYCVVSLGASDYYQDYIRALGIDVVELFIKKRPIISLIKLYKIARQTDTLCCWMYHANFIGYYIGRLARVKRIIWCIRHSNLDKDINKNTTLWINRKCSKISKKVGIITYNGNESRSVHEKIGYYKEKGVVIGNGCDINEYFPNPMIADKLKNELSISQEKKIILSVTRDHPIKDIPSFIKAFALAHRKENNAVAVMCGNGVERENNNLVQVCIENGLAIGRDIFFLGLRNDIPYLLAGCDLFVLHSVGEAFPNTLIQAMSCGCLCMATDVGDVRSILNNNNCIVAAKDVFEICNKMLEMIKLSDDIIIQYRAKNRERVIEKYNIKNVVQEYEKLM